MTMPFGAALSPDAHAFVARLLESQGYRELVAADTLAAGLRFAPSLDDKVLLAHQVSQELQHFEAVSALYEELGEGDLFEVVKRRLARVPEPSSWLEAVVVQSLVCRAGRFHLRAHLWPAYAPYTEIVKRILQEEEDHQAAADGLLRDLCRDGDAAVRLAQAHLEQWLRPALLSFDHFEPSLPPDHLHEAAENLPVIREFVRDVRLLATQCGLTMPPRETLGLGIPSSAYDS
jgi:1,2-phenylacetyl-CoA epoxidase catalytic subunit